MSYTIRYDPEAQVIESKFQGDLRFGEIKDFICQAAQLAEQHGCSRFLTDYQEATLKISTMEIYQVPTLMRNAFASSALDIHRLKRALVVAKDLKDFRFYETIMVNAGQSTQVFVDNASARKWLLAE